MLTTQLPVICMEESCEDVFLKLGFHVQYWSQEVCFLSEISPAVSDIPPDSRGGKHIMLLSHLVPGGATFTSDTFCWSVVIICLWKMHKRSSHAIWMVPYLCAKQLSNLSSKIFFNFMWANSSKTEIKIKKERNAGVYQWCCQCSFVKLYFISLSNIWIRMISLI